MTSRRLDRATQSWFEDRFQEDLQPIRIWDDARSHALAQAAGADAFAIGDDIFFRTGMYQPHTPAGRSLLAHELTHCLQQRRRLAHPQSEALCEAEAAEAALAISGGARWQCSVADQAGQLRRVVSIKPGSAHLHIKQRCKVVKPSVSQGTATFECSTNVSAEGSVVLVGSGPADQWTLGFIQVEWVDTNWLYYRGQYDHDGSAFYQRSRPPSRPVKVCRDVDPPTDIFYTDSWKLPKVKPTDTFPLTLKVHHSDQPSDSCDVVVKNTKTNKDNFLREAQLGFLFCTVLTARDQNGKYHHLKSFYWNVRWQAVFEPYDFGNPNGHWHVKTVAEGMGDNASGVIEGEPTDNRFKKVLTDPAVPGCNSLIPFYTDKLVPPHPCIRESKVWANFDVRV